MFSKIVSLVSVALSVLAAACGGGGDGTPDGSNNGGGGPGGGGVAGCDDDCTSDGGGSTSGGGSASSSSGTTSGGGKVCHPGDGDCVAGDTCECILTEDQAASCEAMKNMGIEDACAPEKSYCKVEDSFDSVAVTYSCGWDLEEGETYVRPPDAFLEPLWNSNWSNPDSSGEAEGKIDENGYFVWFNNTLTYSDAYEGCILTVTPNGPQCKWNRKNKMKAESAIITFRADGKEAWSQWYDVGDVPLGEPDYASWNYNY